MVIFPFFSSRALALTLTFAGLISPAVAAPLSQPVAPVRPVTDTYFGTPVVDNYRWMEDLKSPEVQAWMTAQAAYTHDYLSKLPGRDALVKRIESLDNASVRVGEVQLCGPYLFLSQADATGPDAKALCPQGAEGRRAASRRSANPG
jgi:prolyl oligopeptidase